MRPPQFKAVRDPSSRKYDIIGVNTGRCITTRRVSKDELDELLPEVNRYCTDNHQSYRGFYGG